MLPNKNPLATLEDEESEHVKKLSRMKEEMEEVFGRKVLEKRTKLSENEKEMEITVEESREAVEDKREELARQRKQFEKEKQV